MGSHSSFTLGMFGALGGFALEKGGPAENGTFIGYKTASGVMHYLPFFTEIKNDVERYTLEEMQKHKLVTLARDERSGGYVVEDWT